MEQSENTQLGRGYMKDTEKVVKIDKKAKGEAKYQETELEIRIAMAHELLEMGLELESIERILSLRTTSNYIHNAA